MSHLGMWAYIYPGAGICSGVGYAPPPKSQLQGRPSPVEEGLS
ncbi:unnamed protein product [Penicillium camemberti]|uniref:Str. FM013 n=1 Tax=Penicillium camemberti (strain FM 013) TaxID=1429867 RepID=A0A0G4PLD8_PENC3|nr:unnamed protein product [Penicillium camemberti]